MRRLRSSVLTIASLSACFACVPRPPGLPDPAPEPGASTSNAVPITTEESVPPPETPPAAEVPVDAPGGRDPTGGNFTLSDATAGLEGAGALVATIKTSRGEIRC